MDFRELNYVLAIEKYQNITKAADSLYVSQPTLSKFLMNLENTLGQKLSENLEINIFSPMLVSNM